MAIDDQVALGTVFVVADFRGEQRRIGELGKALAEKAAHPA